MRVERDAVVGEIRVERIAKALFRGHAHERAFGVEQLLLRGRQGGVRGERVQRQQGDAGECGFHAGVPMASKAAGRLAPGAAGLQYPTLGSVKVHGGQPAPTA
jgi:hypothetical protein